MWFWSVRKKSWLFSSILKTLATLEKIKKLRNKEYHMGSLSRKMRRKQARDQKKKAEKAIKNVSKSLDTMPKLCGGCGVDFDSTDKDMLNQWRLAVYDNGTIHLT